MRKNSFKYFIVLIVIINSVYSQDKLNINYENYMKMVQANNPLALRANNLDEIGKNQLRAARGNYDPFLKSDIESKFYNEKNYYTVTSAELKQPIFTSQYIKAGYEYGQGNFLDPQNITSVNGLPYLGFEVSLLQGMMIDKRRAEVIKGKFYNQFYSAEKNIQLNDLLFQSSLAYFELLYYNRNLVLNGFFSNLAKERLAGIQLLSMNGERPAVDTIEASIFYQTRLLDQRSALIEFIKSQNQLIYFSNQTNKLESEILVKPADSIDVFFASAVKLYNNLNVNDSVVNPFIIQYEAKQGVLETEMKLRKEMVKPKLDVNYNLLSNSVNNSFAAFSTKNYKYGASLSFPLFLRNPRMEFKIAKLNAMNNRLEMNNKQNQLSYKRKYLKESAKVVLEQVFNAQKSADFSKKLVEAEKLKFANGESSLFLLNSRESKWLETELKLVDSKLKFLKLVLELIYIEGKLDYLSAFKA